MEKEFTWSPQEETVKCSNCFGDFEDDEVIQRSCVRGRRQYICFACIQDLEDAQPEQAEAA